MAGLRVLDEEMATGIGQLTGRRAYPPLVEPYRAACPECGAGVGEWCAGREGRTVHPIRHRVRTEPVRSWARVAAVAVWAVVLPVQAVGVFTLAEWAAVHLPRWALP